MNVTEQTTNFLYTLEDGTGKVEARRWREQNSEEDADKWGDIQCVILPSVHYHLLKRKL